MTEEIRDLFQYIGRYKPHNIELETKLKPFIPEYIPAVGDIDEFIKVPRPDGQPDFLGLKVTAVRRRFSNFSYFSRLLYRFSNPLLSPASMLVITGPAEVSLKSLVHLALKVTAIKSLLFFAVFSIALYFLRSSGETR